MNDFNKMPAVLYYYCNINDFFDIIINKRLAFQDMKESDKFANVYTLTDVLHNRLKANMKPLNPNTPASAMFQNLTLGEFNMETTHLEMTMIPLFYFLSLTANRNKWYMYEKNKTDICIGFTTELFKFDEFSELFDLKKVNYDTKQFENRIDEIITKYMQNAERNDKFIQENFDDDLLFDSLYYKNNFFSDENEYRVVLKLYIKELFLGRDMSNGRINKVVNHFLEKKTFSLSKSEFITRDNHLISCKYLKYYDLLNYIKTIDINPMCSIEKSDINLLLSAKDVNVGEIKIEKIVLR